MERLQSGRRVLIVHQSLQPPGGSRLLAAWILEALKERHVLTVATWAPFDLRELNRFCGTSLRRGELELLTVPRPIRTAFAALPSRVALLERAVLIRFVKRWSRRHDVVLSADNEIDFGRRGIQYVHHPAYTLSATELARTWRWAVRLKRVYRRVADTIAGTSEERVRSNLTLVNSNWTGDNYRAKYAADAATVYPPVSMRFDEVPWSERTDDFLCIGRLCPEKRLDDVIDIVARVREEMPRVGLHLVGTGPSGAYPRRLRRRVREQRDWLTLHEDLSRDVLAGLMPRYRFGIHGTPEEHFGLAPAEMAAAGCIVFVPRGGGQTEIVGHDPRLTYGSVDDAVASILAVMRSPEQQRAVRAMLADRRSLFSLDRFVSRIRAIVAEFGSDGEPGERR
jgi:glycosyltransferase involved in cell wall biosynthesis